MARVAAGLVSLGYQRLRGCNSSDISPDRIAMVATAALAGVARRSRELSQLNSQNVLLRRRGPDTTVPNWFRCSAFLACVGARKNPRASNILLRRNSNTVPCNWFVPDLMDRFTCAPEFMPYSAE